MSTVAKPQKAVKKAKPKVTPKTKKPLPKLKGKELVEDPFNLN